MVWGGIGGVIGFLTSLSSSLLGVLMAGFVGFSCGRRAAAAEVGKRTGAISGLISGAVAAPAYVLGCSVGALVAARGLGSDRITRAVSDVVGMRVSPEVAWQLFLLGILFAAILQVGILLLASTAAGAWTVRGK